MGTWCLLLYVYKYSHNEISKDYFQSYLWSKASFLILYQPFVFLPEPVGSPIYYQESPVVFSAGKQEMSC